MDANSYLAQIAAKFRDAFAYDPGHSDLDNEQPITITVTLGDWRALNMALASQAGPDDQAVALLREALREQRRWRSCQSIGVCRQCVDDGVTLRIQTFLDALGATSQISEGSK